MTESAKEQLVVVKTEVSDEEKVDQAASGEEDNFDRALFDVERDRLQEHEEAEGVHGREGGCGGVRVSELESLDHDQHHHHVPGNV